MKGLVAIFGVQKKLTQNVLLIRYTKNDASFNKYGIILCHNGDIIKYKVNEDANLEYADMVLNNMQDDYYDIEKRNSHIKILKDAGVILDVFS